MIDLSHVVKVYSEPAPKSVWHWAGLVTLSILAAVGALTLGCGLAVYLGWIA